MNTRWFKVEGATGGPWQVRCGHCRHAFKPEWRSPSLARKWGQNHVANCLGADHRSNDPSKRYR